MSPSASLPFHLAHFFPTFLRPQGTPTYTPRMVFFDLCGSMGGVKKTGYLYDDLGVQGGDLPPILTWNGSSKVYKSAPAPRSTFLMNLENLNENAENEYDDEEDPDEHMDVDDDEEDEDEYGSRGRRGNKWGGGGAGGCESDPIHALRAKMAGQLLASPTKKPKLEGMSEEQNRAKKEEKARAAAQAAAALEASAEKLEDEARSWTDLQKACLHPKSTFLLSGLWQGVDAFAGFGEGSEYVQVEDRREDLRDRVRFWAEECDSLRGFQLSAEDLSGFGGLAVATIEELRDEYASTPISIFSLRPPANQQGADAKMEARVSFLNDALTTSLLAPSADMYVPIAGLEPPRVRPSILAGLQPNSRYHAAAVAAACMDTASLPWRVNGSAGGVGGAGMRSVARHLSARAGGPFAALSAALPARSIPDPYIAARAADEKRRKTAEAERSGGREAARYSAREDDEEAADRAKARAMLSDLSDATRLSRRVSDRDDEDADRDDAEPMAEVYSLRGAHQLVGDGERGNLATDDGQPTRRATPRDALTALDAALRYEAYRVPRHRCVSAAPLPLPLPFPRIFAPSGPNPTEVPMLTRLASTSRYGAVLERVNAGWRRASKGAAGKAALRSWGFGEDDVGEVGETLKNMAQSYGGESDADDFSDDEDLEQI